MRVMDAFVSVHHECELLWMVEQKGRQVVSCEWHPIQPWVLVGYDTGSVCVYDHARHTLLRELSVSALSETARAPEVSGKDKLGNLRQVRFMDAQSGASDSLRKVRERERPCVFGQDRWYVCFEYVCMFFMYVCMNVCVCVF